MNRLKAAARTFLASEAGPTAVEYGVLLALIVAVAIAAITLLARNAEDILTEVGDTLEGESR